MLYHAIFLLCLVAAARAKDAQSPKIIIVGAGASGISAATKLLENGFNNVLILEAENRIGGRIYTTKFDDYLVDLGAQWIDGERGNVANDLASPLNLTDHPMPNMPFNFKTYTSSGELIDPAVDHNITDVHVHIYDYVDTTSKECQTSVGECFTHKYGLSQMHSE